MLSKMKGTNFNSFETSQNTKHIRISHVNNDARVSLNNIFWQEY